MAEDKLTTCLWFDKGEARKAAEFYASVFPDSKVGARHSAVADFPGGEEGEELTVDFTVLGRPFVGLNGGPNFKANEAVSFMVITDDQEETDRYWNAITRNGGEKVRAVGARTNGASRGRSRLAFCSRRSTIPIAPPPSEHSKR